MSSVARVIRTDDEGVASTVGTTMALLVFLTFISLIVNQYVPAWMEDSEAAHVNAVIGQFGGFKEALDLQILTAQQAASSGRTYVPVTATTAINLGVDGVPIFSSSTPGTMTAFPAAGAFSVIFDYQIQGVRRRVAAISNGTVEIELHNRYYIPQRIVYENGAIIRDQGNGQQVIRGAPIFTAGRVNNALDLTFGLVSLYGGGTVSGTTTEVVSSQLFAFDFQSYVTFPADARIWVNHTSPYGLAWYHFLNATLADRLKLPGTFTKTALDVRFDGKVGAVIVYTVWASYNPATRLYTLRLEFINRPGVLPLGTFRLLHSQVQVRVGDITQTA